MKSVIYLLIAVFSFGIIAASIPNTSGLSRKITIQAVENNVAQVDLTESANIITKRLKSYSSEKFDLKVISDKNQLVLSLSDKWDIEVVAMLLTRKGSLEFYETYTQKELSELLNNDNQIYSLLKKAGSEFELGFTTFKELDKVNSYLESLSLKDKCSFAWARIGKSDEVCLYALKSSTESRTLLSGIDIEKASVEQGKSPKNLDIMIKFKEAAVKKWAEATKRNIDRAIAMVFDGAVISSPIVRSEINGGSCVISGNFTKTEANSFVSILQNGKLPVDFKIVK
jgi:preprotein translocase subunit SecD